MSDVTLLFNSAELAFAAYSNLIEGDTASLSNRQGLLDSRGAGMALTEATEFAKRFPTITTQFNDTLAEGGMGTSFSATVFKDSTGKLTLAIRGTHEKFGAPNDLVPTDADIGFLGAGYDQIVAMVNWWGRVSAPAGQMVNQFRLLDAPSNMVPAGAVVLRAGSAAGNVWVLDVAPQVVATGGLVRDALVADPDLRVEVTGHSLGGHLAMAFSTLFAAQTGQVTVFNAPGFWDTAINQAFFAKLGGSIPPNTAVANITNVISNEALIGAQPFNGVAGLRTRPGIPIDIAIENQWNSDEPAPPGSINHSMMVLTDALAVYRLLTKLDPNLNPTNYKTILNQIVRGTATSYEGIVDALEALFGVNRDPLPTGNNNRNALYEAIYALQSNPNPPSLSTFNVLAGNLNITALGTLTVAQIIDKTSESNLFDKLAYRYALKELNPFAVAGSDALYAPHNQNGELNLYDTANRTGALTDEWIADRTAFLTWKNLAYANDTPVNNLGVTLLQTNQISDAVRFVDVPQKLDLGVVPPGGGMPAVNNAPRYVFGGDSSDRLTGGVKADSLYGGAGDDHLVGGRGADYLEGGTGRDTYIWNTGDGFDTILDTDGSGSLEIDGHVLTSGIAVASGDYFTIDNQSWLHFEGNLSTGGTLTVNGALRVEEFRNGDLGITLGTPGTLSDLQPTDNQLPIIVDPDYPTQIGTNGSDEAHVRDLARPWPQDLRLLMTLGGDDLVVFDGPFYADNFVASVSAGEGNDFVITTSASEFADGELFVSGGVVEGGAGQDTIIGGDGADILVGDSNALRAYISLENFSPTFNLDYSEPDTFGTDGAYFFFSGVDNIGGYGIEGDDGVLLRFFPNGISEVLNWLGLSSPVDDPRANDDSISGGSGDDNISGGAGNDDLFGGVGDDQLYGDSYSPTWPLKELIRNSDIRNIALNYFLPLLLQPGNDYLDGGDGNDRLFDLDGGSNVLLGGGGDDILKSDDEYVHAWRRVRSGSPVANLLDGGEGDDELSAFSFGLDGVDTLIGGGGNDSLSFESPNGVGILDGGSGSDIYYLSAFYLAGEAALSNKVIIRDEESGVGEVDVLALNNLQGLLDGLSFSRDDSNLYLNPSGRVDWITIENWFVDPKFKIEKIEVYGSFRHSLLSQFDIATIESQLVTPTAGNDFLWGTSSSDQLSGGGGDDELHGNAAGDALYGGEGNDVVVGGAGYDTLDGGAGDDTYVFNLGDGVDTIADSAGDDTIKFGDGILSSDLALDLGSLLIHVGTEGDAIHIENFDRNNAAGSSAIEHFTFVNGTSLSYAELLTRGFDVTGTYSDDNLIGTDINDRIRALYGNDTVTGGAGDDVLDGGPGDDLLDGGTGGDIYRFGREDGADTLQSADVDASNLDTVQFKAGVSEQDVHVSKLGVDISLAIIGTQDSIKIINGFANDVIDQVTFTNGTTWNAATLRDFASSNANTNDAPTLANAIADQPAIEDAVFSYTVPANTFADVDVGDMLTYSATQANGSALPAWLTFNATTRTFSGTPLNNDVGTLSVKVKAADGAGENVTDTFDVTVANTNDAPTLANAIADQSATEDAVFSYTVPANTFADVDVDVGDTFTYSATQAGGSSLPTWLTFNAATRTLSGTPLNDDVGTLSVKITATDVAGAAVADTFDIAIANTNDAPTLAGAIADHAATEDAAFSYTIATKTFADVDVGDTLTYSATHANGSALPAWLSFNASTRTFSGTPLNNDVGTLSVKVKATDGAGENVTDSFDIAVANTNDAPTLANAMADQPATEDAVFSYTVPANTFADVDVGDTLTYSATQTDGSALPTWLTFNATTRTFSGTPLNDDVSTLSVEVKAADGAGENVTDTFDVTVANTNDAPTLANAIADQSATEDAVFSYTVPANTFADVDVGDTFTYSATQAGGSALPTWLTFNAATRTLSGTPLNDDVGTLSVKITATDVAGAAVADTFDIAIANTNDAPTLAGAIADHAATEDAAFSYTIAAKTFADVDVGDTLTYSATRADGTALPTWLAFNAATGTFNGTPLNDDVGTLSVKVKAVDDAGESVTDSFDIAVANTNDAPMLANAIADQSATEDAAFSYTVAANTFADVDVGDTLTYSATRADGSALPTWLTFNAATRTFSGTPLNNDVGTLSVKVKAADGAGENVTDSFDIAVANTNDAPLALANVVAVNENATSANLVASLLANDSDVDVGDTLRISAVNTTGTVGAVAFNAALQTLTYSANAASHNALAQGASASDSFTYTAADSSNATATATVTVTVTGVNDAPTVANALPDQSAVAGVAFSYAFTANAFNDVDVGDTLTYRATRADGSALPAWLSFNPSARTFSGTPATADAGTLNLKVTATDPHGSLATDLFDISISTFTTLTGTAGADTLTGTAANNLINGLGGNDTLIGLGGDDTLNGGSGNDSMAGGRGNDTYIVDSTSDIVTEAANQGIDTVNSSVTRTLGANLENLTLTGAAAINGTGNALANVLRGNSGANVLTGGAGNDTYYVSSGDSVIESNNQGTDSVVADVSWTLGNNIENLTLTGSAAINGTGNALNNRITGNAGNNILNGGSGTDTLAGGAGNDTYVVGNSNDVVTENLNEGTDAVQASVTYTLGANVENLTLTGASAINGTGNTLDNILTGNSGANVLTGLAGNDTYFIAGSDTVVEAAGAGEDLVNSGVTHTLAANVEHLILTAAAALNGTGNTLNNLLRGNAGINTLTGRTGNDMLEGGGAGDILIGNGGRNYLNGQGGADGLIGGAGNEIFIGGAGNDSITTGAGADIIAFNRGDGSDTVASSTGQDNTLSLGGGIRYADLFFQKSGANLILKTAGSAASEGLTFVNWYSSTSTHSMLNLQMVAEASADFDASSANPLRNRKVAEFNFGALANQFDAARAATPGLSAWALSNGLAAFHLSGSDSAALGGDLAYQYGLNGNLANVGTLGAQNVLGDAQFGTGVQALQALPSLQDGMLRLS